MRIRNLLLPAVFALGLGVTTWMAPQAAAQQPYFDIVHISFPMAVTVGEKTIPAGEYLIQELRSEDPTILLFYNDRGMKFQVSALTFKTLDANTARSTDVTLRQVGDNYYIDKLWIQGKSFGFAFPLPRGAEEK